jgi:hypothetical protein
MLEVQPMQLNHSLQLTYCTNVHRGETWPEIYACLQTDVLAIRDRVCPQKPFAIGLRLGEQAARELGERETLAEFRRWLGKNSCYVFTINGFAYGQFHGRRVKEHVYNPDWAFADRVAYTNQLFNILAELLPPGIEGSVSTVPGFYKPSHPSLDAVKTIRQNIWRTVEYAARVASRSGRKLHLGLEPEPLCMIESSAETLNFFEHLRSEHPRDERLAEHLGINYDTCHFAVECEEPQNALGCLVHAGIKISKIQLSSALKVVPTPAAREELKKYANDVYLHQVVARDAAGNRTIFEDLPDALADARSAYSDESIELPEWRIHFHVPLHAPAAAPFDNTTDHLLGVLDILSQMPQLCSHLEMETYTWEVLPPELKSFSVVDQVAAEYAWTLEQMRERGLA